MSLSAEALACALAAARVLESARLAGGARARARRSPRGWPGCWPSAAARWRRAGTPRSCRSRAPTPSASASTLREHGVILRNIPDKPWLRASVGAWNDEDDLDRLLGRSRAMTLPHELRSADDHHPRRHAARRRTRRHAARRRGGRVRPQHVALAAVLALSAVLNINQLARNDYAQHVLLGRRAFDAALAAQLLLRLVRPRRAGHGRQAAGWACGCRGSAPRCSAFTPLSLLLPEAIIGVLAVAALYWVVTPRFGPAAGVASALALAVFPSFVAVSRDNSVDAVLILLMILACGVGAARDRIRAGCARCWVRGARGARVQHEDAGRVPRRPGARARLSGVRAGIARAPVHATARGRRRAAASCRPRGRRSSN